MKYVSKIFRKNDISYPMICTRACAYGDLKIIVFWKGKKLSDSVKKKNYSIRYCCSLQRDIATASCGS